MDAGEISRVLLARHLRWMQRSLGRRPATIREREYAILRMARWLRAHGVEDPVLATREDLAAWQLDLTGGVGNWRGQTNHAIQFYRWAYAEREIDSDPAATLVRPKAPTYLPRPVPAEIAEEAYLAAASHPDQRIIRALILAGYCGLRACEIVRLRGEDVWLDEEAWRLRVVGKGGDEDVIPIDATVVEALKRYGLPGHGLVVPRVDSQPGELSRQGLSVLVARFLRGLGIEGWRLHTWRHRFGTTAYRKCKDILLTGQLMRHKTTVSTKGYVKVNALEGAEVMRQVAADLPGFAAVHDLAERRERRRAERDQQQADGQPGGGGGGAGHHDPRRATGARARVITPVPGLNHEPMARSCRDRAHPGRIHGETPDCP